LLDMFLYAKPIRCLMIPFHDRMIVMWIRLLHLLSISKMDTWKFLCMICLLRSYAELCVLY